MEQVIFILQVLVWLAPLFAAGALLSGAGALARMGADWKRFVDAAVKSMERP